MSITIPSFQPLQTGAPLPGLWRRPAPEGPKQANIEVDWQAGAIGTAVQITAGAQSVVSMSQIASLYVDNSRSGADVEFIFADTGFTFVVPAREGGLYPVLSNALMFYAQALAAEAGDVTVIQVLNEYPAPISISPASVQTISGAQNGSLSPGAVASTIVASGVNGTLRSMSIIVSQNSAIAGAAAAFGNLQDGNGKIIWGITIQPAPSSNLQIPVGPINARFTNGLSFHPGTLFTAGVCILVFNVYYTVP